VGVEIWLGRELGIQIQVNLTCLWLAESDFGGFD
jgi:hypothetical protein